MRLQPRVGLPAPLENFVGWAKVASRPLPISATEDYLACQGESCACIFSIGETASAFCVGKSRLGLVCGRVDGQRRLLCAVLLPGFKRLHVHDERMRSRQRSRPALFWPVFPASRLRSGVLRRDCLHARLWVSGRMRAAEHDLPDLPAGIGLPPTGLQSTLQAGGARSTAGVLPTADAAGIPAGADASDLFGSEHGRPRADAGRGGGRLRSPAHEPRPRLTGNS